MAEGRREMDEGDGGPPFPPPSYDFSASSMGEE